MAAVYGIMFSIGQFLFLRSLEGFLVGVVGIAALVWMVRKINRGFARGERARGMS